MNQKNSRVSLHPVVAIPIAAMVILASTLLVEVLSLRTAMQLVDHADQVISADRELLKLNLDMETGLRGFLYTGKVEFLQPYREAAQVVDSKFAALNGLVSDNRSQEVQLAGIRASFDQWRLQAGGAIARRTEDSIRDSEEDRFKKMLERKASMDEIRARYARFESSEAVLRSQQVQRVRSKTLLVGITCILMAFGGGSGLALLVRRQLRLSAAWEEEEAIWRSDEKLRRLVLGVKDYAVLMLDTEGGVVTWNEGAERIKGYRAEEIIGSNFSTFYPAEIAAQGKPALELKIAAKDGRYEEEGWRVRKDGSQYWASVVITALHDESGQLSGFAKVIRDIPAPEEAGHALLTAEALRRAIFNSANFSKIATDANGVIQIFNVGAERMLGYKASDVINKLTPADISDPLELVARAQALSAELETPIAQGFEALVFKASRGIEDIYELTYIRKDGSRFPALVSVTALRDAVDAVIGYLLIGTDNTARWQIEEKRKQAEEALRSSEAALRISEDLLDRTGRLAEVGGWELDLVSGVVNWSAETGRLHGVDPAYDPTLEEAIDFYAPEARPIVRAAVERSMVDGRPWELEVPVIRADGRRIWARVVASVEFSDGKPVRLVGAFQDVTARVAEQHALQEANTRATLATESGGIGIWSCDILSGILSWDSWMYRLYGMAPREQMTGNYELWREHLHPDDREAAEQALRDCVDGLRPFDISFRIVWDDGGVHHLRAAGQVNRDEAGRAVRMVGANWDVTELTQAIEVAREAMKIAEDSSRIKSDFLANMSHEIRTPMNAIIGMTYLALRAAPSPKQERYLTKISNAAKLLLGVINDILDFSKVEAGKLELENIPFSLNEVLNGLNDVVSERAEHKRIAIVFSIARDVPHRLMGDPLRLRQVLINLLNNAIKFTDSGEIVVKVSAEDVTDDKGRLSFSVRDTGVGMTPEQVARLFQSFNQADTSFTRKYGGTGLGLAISMQLCVLMGGTLTVESELGKGSTFLFTATFGIATAVAQAGLRTRTGDIQKRSILVVDDDEDSRELLVDMLRTNGFMARAVTSGEDALSALAISAQVGEPFDMVLMDWRLPGIDGIEASRRAKSHLTFMRMPAILMISSFEREEVMAGLADPALDGFLVKPISESLLVKTIEAIFHEQEAKRIPEFPIALAPKTAELVGRRVLLIEDNEINRELATELLSDLGISVAVAFDGSEGVDRVVAEPFDLVLMDIQMPVMDGFTATKLIRERECFRSLPIIAMTACAMSGDRERSLRAGMNDHLTKPIDPERLTEALIRWMPLKPKELPEPATAAAQPTHSEEAIPESLPPFDIKAALVRTNGKPKLLRKIMFGFRVKYCTGVSDLREHIAEGRLEDAQRFAHSLKGIAATLEARELTAAASAIEDAFRTERTDSMNSLIDTMERALGPAITAAGTLEATVELPSHPL